MTYNQVILSRVREYLRCQDQQALVNNAPRPTEYSRIYSFSVPTMPRDNYNEVFPGIFIGNQKYCSDKAKLRSIGITHVVNCAKGSRYTQINTSAAYFRDVGIQFHGIQASDLPTFDMSPKFREAAEFIHKALNQGGKVFVHCHMGISRSSTIVLAYLMIKQRIPLLDAVRTVRQRREIMPNDGFLKQLCILNFELFEPKKFY